MKEEIFMEQAIRLAKKALGRTSPNPMVGAVIVKDSQVLSTGFHRKAGEPHAEIDALRKAGSEARGADLYVNLEPCNHVGRTGPCTKAIIDSGIKKVVIGMEDPNPLVSGKGIRELKENGIEVKVGVLEERCKKLNEMFVKYIVTKTPFIILKVAASLDGKVATKNGESRWITGQRARYLVHKLRDRVDAVMVGIGTVLKDDPLLTTRLKGGRGKDAIRIVVDSSLRIPLQANIINTASKARTIVATTDRASSDKIARLKEKGVEVLVVSSRKNRVDLNELAVELGKREIMSVLLEGGPRLSASALEAGIVDKALFFYAPKIIGGEDAPGIVAGEGVDSLAKAILLEDIKIKKLGEDFLVEGYVHRNN